MVRSWRSTIMIDDSYTSFDRIKFESEHLKNQYWSAISTKKICYCPLLYLIAYYAQLLNIWWETQRVYVCDLRILVGRILYHPFIRPHHIRWSIPKVSKAPVLKKSQTWTVPQIPWPETKQNIGFSSLTRPEITTLDEVIKFMLSTLARFVTKDRFRTTLHAVCSHCNTKQGKWVAPCHEHLNTSMNCYLWLAVGDIYILKS